MYHEYYADQSDPQVRTREEIRQKPGRLSELFSTAKQISPNLTMREFLTDLGFDEAEITNFLVKLDD